LMMSMKVNFIDFHQICRSTSASFPIYCLLTNMTTTNHPKQQQRNDDQPHPTAVTTTTTVSHLPRRPTTPPPPTTMKRMIILLHALQAFIENGYPIAAIQYDTQSDFLFNQKGFPTFSKINQLILEKRRLIRNIYDPSFMKYDVQYMQHIRTTKIEITLILDTIYAQEKEMHYLDSLQSPLQPLKDHLLNHTYELFESDPMKYIQYQKAIQLCMEDIIYYHHQNHSQSQNHLTMMTTTTTTTTTNTTTTPPPMANNRGCWSWTISMLSCLSYPTKTATITTSYTMFKTIRH
jgi:PRMT5 arginine-N-methyltransferase